MTTEISVMYGSEKVNCTSRENNLKPLDYEDLTGES